MKGTNVRIPACAALIAVAAAVRLCGVEIYPNAGTTSAAFLKLGAGCRALSMGSAFAGLADDVTALYWNPAGLAQLQQPEFEVYHNESFESIRNDFAGYAAPFRKGVISGGITALYTPKDIERRAGLNEADPYEPLSPVDGLFQAYDVAAHFGYARWLNRNLAGGIGVKFIQQTIDDTSAYGLGADFGLLYRASSLPLSTGLVIQHAGTPIKFINTAYPQPLNFKLGSAWRWNKRLVTTFDINKSIDNYPFISAGGEYIPVDFLALRAGYRYRVYGLELGDLSGMSCGVGFNFRVRTLKLKVDYAFIPFGVLGNSQHLSINIQFGKAPARTAMARPATAPAAKTKDYGTRVLSPSLPQKPATAGIPGKAGGYAYYPAKLNARRRIATGRITVYGVHGDVQGGDIQEFEGTIKMGDARMLQIEAGEKAGAGKVYRHYAFIKNVPNNLVNASCILKLPSSFGSFAVRTQEGKLLQATKVRTEGSFDYYRVPVESLQSFYVEKL